MEGKAGDKGLPDIVGVRKRGDGFEGEKRGKAEHFPLLWG